MITIRSSLLPTYNDCQRRAAAQQWPEAVAQSGHKIGRSKNNVLALIGTGTHSGTQYQAECKKSGEILTDGTCSRSIDAGISKYRECAAEGVDYDDTTRNQNDAEKQISRLTKLYFIRVMPEINPDMVEARISFEFGGGWKITGQIDLVHRITEKTFSLRDTKTGAKIKLHSAQLGCYSILLSRLMNQAGNGHRVVGCGIDFLHRAALNKPVSHKYIGYDKNVSEKLALETMRRIKQDYERFIVSGDPWSFMCNTNSILCSPKYCRAFGTDWCEVTK